MPLFKRVSRLFAADVHAVLDRLEEPEVVLKQAIREMEEDFAQQVQRCNWLRREIATADSRLARLGSVESELDSRLDVCFANDNDELARRVVRRRLEARRQRESIEAEKAGLEDTLADAEAVVGANRERLDSLRQKASLVAEEAPDGRSPGRGEDPIGDDEVEIEFLRVKQARAVS